MEWRGNWVTLMSMCVGLLVGTVVGVRSRVRKSRQGREAAVKGLKVVRKVVIVLIGIGILVVGLIGLECQFIGMRAQKAIFIESAVCFMRERIGTHV